MSYRTFSELFANGPNNALRLCGAAWPRVLRQVPYLNRIKINSLLASVTSWRLCQNRQNLLRENRGDLAMADRYLELITMETTTQTMFFHFRLVAATFFYVFLNQQKIIQIIIFTKIHKKRKAANMIGNEWARVKWSRVTIKQQN